MRSYLRILIITLFVVAVAMTGTAAELMGRVEAVYHEGVMSFNIEHVDAVSASIRIYDLETDALIYDGGPQARTTVTWPAGHNLKGSYRYVVTAWNAEGQVVVSQAASTKSFTPIASFDFDTIPANTKFLGANDITMLADVHVGDPGSIRLDLDQGGLGSATAWYEEDGITEHTKIEPDWGGGGGYFQVLGNTVGSYVSMEGDSENDEAMFRVLGTSDFHVYAGFTGDLSVQMPASAVSAAETLDEPGVASDFNTVTLVLGPGPLSIETRTITAPAAGYVLAVAFTDLGLIHSNGSTSYAQCSIATAGFNVEYEDGLAVGQISANAPSGSYQIPISANRLVSVPAGSTQFHFVCRTGAYGNIAVFDRHLDLLYVPTSYGVVTTSAKSATIVESEPFVEGQEPTAVSGTKMTRAESDAERLEAIQFNLDRIQAELAAIQAQSDANQAANDQ